MADTPRNDLIHPKSESTSESAATSNSGEGGMLPELNPVIHGKLRLALLSLLTGVDRAEFIWLRQKTGATDGNLGAHLLKLEEAGYVATEKKFVERKPVSLYWITELGRSELIAYVRALKVLLAGAL